MCERSIRAFNAQQWLKRNAKPARPWEDCGTLEGGGGGGRAAGVAARYAVTNPATGQPMLVCRECYGESRTTPPPTPAEIRAACREIQSTWTEFDWRIRAVSKRDPIVTRTYSAHRLRTA